MTHIETISIFVSLAFTAWAVVKGVPQAIRIGKRILDGVVTVEQISEQFKPNGGSTIKDVLDRLESLMIIERERNRAVCTMLPTGMFETDAAGLVIWVSSKYTEITGSNLDEAEGWNWSAIVHHEDRTRVVDEWKSAVAQQRRAIVSHRILTEYGERHVLVETFPVHNGDKCIGHIGLVCLVK